MTGQLVLEDIALQAAAEQLIHGATTLRTSKELSMIQAEHLSVAAETVGDFIRGTDLAREALSDAAAEAAAQLAALMCTAAEVEAQIVHAIGPGFVR